MTAESGLRRVMQPDAGWLVVDASVAAKWFLEENLSAQARGLLSAAEELLAPRIIIAELGNVLLKKVRLGEMQRASVDDALDVFDLFVTLRPDDRVFYRAFAVALEHGRSFYDALYVALALQEGCRLVTADERLVNALRPSFGDTMLWLGDLPPAV